MNHMKKVSNQVFIYILNFFPRQQHVLLYGSRALKELFNCNFCEAALVAFLNAPKNYFDFQYFLVTAWFAAAHLRFCY